MVFMDRSLLTFDLVTRLSQVIKSANATDINASNKIIDRLLDSCRCLRGDCHLSSTLEQSTITLLLDLAATNENIRIKIMPPLVEILHSIDSDQMHWCDKFDDDFGTTFLIHMMKCDQGSQYKVSSSVLEQLDSILTKAASSNDVPRELIIAQGIFGAIGAATRHLWGDDLRSIISYSHQAIKLAASFNQNIHFTLAAAVLTTCKTLVVEATSDIGHSAQESYQKLAHVLLPTIVEIAAVALSSLHDDTALKRSAVLLLAASTRMNRVYREVTFQHGLLFLKGIKSLGLGRTNVADSHNVSTGIEEEDEGEYVTVACRELSYATEVVTALHSTLAQDSESLHHLVGLSQLLSTACLSLHSGGRLHQYVQPTQSSSVDSTFEGNPSSHFQPSDVEKTTACTELKNFSSACFLVLRDEVLGLGVENTSCKKLFQVSFEYCICPDNYNDVPGSSAMFAGEDLGSGDGFSQPFFQLRPDYLERTISDTLFQPVVRMSDAHFYTSYRMASMIGAAVEGICLSSVFDVVYPGLADLLARAGGIPQLSLILSTQMARLAIASLSYHTPPPGHTGPTGHTGHTGFGQRYGQGGAGNGYWELVVECLCSSYSRTVSRMKDLPVEQELVKSATSPSSSLFARSFRRGSKAAAADTTQDIAAVDKKTKMTVDNNDPKGGRAGECALYTVLEGIVGGLDYLVIGLRDRGDWARVKVLRERLMDCLVVLAVDVYGSCEKGSEVNSANTFGGSALGLLLQPMATSFGRTNDPPESAHRLRTTAYRRLWITLVLFRLKESAAWAEHPTWLLSLQHIAVMTPPLVLGPNASTPGFLDRELASNPVLRCFVHPSKSITNVLKGSSKGVIKDKHVLRSLKALARFNVASLSAGQAVFIASVQLLEGLRVGGSTLDLRPLIPYLGDPNLDVLPQIRGEISSVADHVFTVFIEAATTRLQNPRLNCCPDTHVFSQAPPQTLLQLRGVLSQVFEYFLAHCSHSMVLVRTTALRFTGRMLDRLPWLITDFSAVTVMLNSLTLLGYHQNNEEDQVSEDEYSGVSLDGSSVRGAGILPPINPYTAPPATLLPRSSLPVGEKSIIDAALPLLEMSYSWLFSGMRSAHAELSAVLQEYIVTEQAKGSSSASVSPNPTHLGIAMAREAALNASPIFHSSPAAGEISLWETRGLAAFKIASQLQAVDSSTASTVSDLFASQLAVKSRYIRELKLHTVLGTVRSNSPFRTPDTTPRRVSPRESPANIDNNNVNSRTGAGAGAGAGGRYAVIAAAEDAESKLKKSLEVDWSMGGVRGVVEVLVQDMWRAGTAINLLYTVDKKGREGKPTDREEAVALRIVQLLCCAPSLCFTTQTVDCLVAVMQWLLVFAPSLRRLVTIEVTALFVDTAKRGLGLFAPRHFTHSVPNAPPARPSDEASVLLCAGRYSDRLSGFTTHPEVFSALEGSVGGWESDFDPLPHQTLTLFLEQLIRIDATNTSLSPVLQCISTLLLPLHSASTSSTSTSTSTATSSCALTTHPLAAVTHFRLLSFAMRLLRKSLTTPGAPSGPLRRVLRERVVRSCLSYFEAPPVWMDQSTPDLASETFNAVWEFSTLLLEDSRTWTVEYPRGWHGSGPVSGIGAGAGLGSAALVDHRLESGKFFSSGSKSDLAANLAASTFYQRGRCVGSSGAVNYLRTACGGYDSQTGPVDCCVLPLTITSPQGDLGIFCAPLNPPASKPYPPVSKSKRLVNVVSATVVDPEKGTGLGMASGVLCLVRALLLHELDRITAWGEDNVMVGVPEQHRTAAALDFKVTAKDLKAFKLAVRAAWAVSPDLALSLRDRFPSLAGQDGRNKGISALSSLCVENPEGVRHSWRAACVLLVGLTHSAALEKKKKRRSRFSPTGTPSSNGDPELGTQDLLLWASAPVPMVVNMLCRIGSEKDSEAHLFVGVVRYCARSLSVADPEVVAFYMPQLVQLLRRDAFRALAALLLDLATTSALLCHRLIGLLQIEAFTEIDTGKKVKNSSKYGFCNSITGPDPLPLLSRDLLLQIRESLTAFSFQYLREEKEFFDSITDISAQLRITKTKDKDKDKGKDKAQIKEAQKVHIKKAISKLINERTFASNRLYLPTDPTRRVVNIDIDSGIPMQSAAKCPFLLSFVTVPWGGPGDVMSPEEAQSMGIGNGIGMEGNGSSLTKKVSFTGEGRSIGCPSSTSPFSLPLHTLSLSPSQSPSPCSAKQGTFHRTQWSLKKRPLAASDVNSTRSPGSVASLSPLGVGGTGGLCDRDDENDNEHDHMDDSGNENERGGGNMSENERSHADDVVHTDGITLDNLQADRSALLLSRIAAHEKFTAGLGAGASSTGKKPRDTGSDRKSVRYSRLSLPINPMSWRMSSPTKPAVPGKLAASRRTSLPLTRTASTENTRAALEAQRDVASSERCACIFKVYDDCRQDSLVIQVVRILRDEFALAGLPIYLVPYSVVPSRTGNDNAPGGIIQVISNVKSLDQIGKAGSKDILDYFTTQFGAIESASFKKAQAAFIRSMAGYAVVCYLLRIKDRHNGNILVDNFGHVIHIDYGFILGISPGGNLGFETAAFKINADMIVLMGGAHSDTYADFIDLVVKGYLVARSVSEPIMDIVQCLADSGLPCFMHKDDNIERMKARFMLDVTTSEAAKHMRGKVADAADKWTTNAYDGLQKMQNNIY